VELGRCYFTGEGVAFDPKRATQLWTRAQQLAVSGTYVLQTKEDLVPAISECQRALKEVRALGERPEQFNAYQESTLEGNATDKGRYGPYTSPWGASGYVAFLRTKNVVVNTVSARVLYDRLVDGTYLRQPPVEELVALSAELHHLAQTPEPPPPRHGTKEVRTCGGGAKGEWHGVALTVVLFVFCFVCCCWWCLSWWLLWQANAVAAALRLFDEWEIKDLLSRFICGARPDIYVSPVQDTDPATLGSGSRSGGGGSSGSGGGRNCFHAACASGRVSMVALLLNKGCDPMRPTCSSDPRTSWSLAGK
jgi:hypothetical protein